MDTNSGFFATTGSGAAGSVVTQPAQMWWQPNQDSLLGDMYKASTT
jgi:hypothetical protein